MSPAMLPDSLTRVCRGFAGPALLVAAVALLACQRAADVSVNRDSVTATAAEIGADEALAVRRDVAARLAQYTDAARRVDPVASASFFTEQGTLFEPGIPPIVSRDSIRAFVASFPGVVVDSAIATADTIEVYGNTAMVWGSYFEKLHFSGQPVSSQHGKFVMHWLREAGGPWLIHRYYRVPLPDTRPPAPSP